MPVGGRHITNDISILLKINKNDAEKLKKNLNQSETVFENKVDNNSIYLEEKFDFFSEISFFEENTTLICDSGFNFNQSGKFQEVNFLRKKSKNKGFFEKFFHFFN